jgi:hypothetical protein
MSSIPADSSAGSRGAQLAKVRHSDGLVLWRAFELKRPCLDRGVAIPQGCGIRSTAVLPFFHTENRLPLEMR